jgi:hypothetical protein
MCLYEFKKTRNDTTMKLADMKIGKSTAFPPQFTGNSDHFTAINLLFFGNPYSWRLRGKMLLWKK